MAEVYYTVNRSLILLIFIGFDFNFHGWRSKGEIRGRARRAKKVAAGAGSHSNFQICFSQFQTSHLFTFRVQLVWFRFEFLREMFINESMVFGIVR